MKLTHRIAYYLIGLTIGIFFVSFVFSKKKVEFDYMPNARVLKGIRTDERIFTEEAAETMVLAGLDSTDIANILTNGSVDFGASEPRREPCKKYVIDGEPKNKKITLIINKCDSISKIEEIIVKN